MMQTSFLESLVRLWRRGLSPACLGYTVLRLALGMSMFIHGAGRLPKIGAFTDVTVKMFAGSPLPPFAVVAFARVTPPGLCCPTAAGFCLTPPPVLRN